MGGRLFFVSAATLRLSGDVFGTSPVFSSSHDARNHAVCTHPSGKRSLGSDSLSPDKEVPPSSRGRKRREREVARIALSHSRPSGL